MVLFAWLDFALFVFVVLVRLSNLLNIPIFTLPENLGEGGEGQRVPNHGNIDGEQPPFPDTKLESSVNHTFENSPEQKNHKVNTSGEINFNPYGQSQKFDEEAPIDNLSKPEEDKTEGIVPDDQTESEEEKEGDVSYQNDFDGDDKIEI